MPTNKVFWLLMSVLTGCATQMPLVLPQTMPTDGHGTVKLPSRGQLLVMVPLAEGKAVCDEKKPLATLEVTADGGHVLDTAASCQMIDGFQTLYTKEVLKPNDYRVNVTSTASSPTVSVKYLDPDFNAGPDQDYAGALESNAGQPVTGLVNYAAGKTTSWFHVKGKNSRVQLTFIAQDGGENAIAKVYRLKKNGHRPRSEGELKYKVKRHLSLGDDDLYIKVTAQRYRGETHFSILRRDFPLSKKITIPVIDRIRVSESASVILLKAVKGMKAGDEIGIFAKRADGKTMPVGNCEIESLSETEATCQMKKALPTGVTEFHGEASIESAKEGAAS